MGAFIGYGDVGVWANNHERNAFLDWFAAHRCKEGDERWQFCMSPGNRWMGCGIELAEIIPCGEPFEVTGDEQDACADEHWPHVSQLIGIISKITLGKWTHLVSSREAVEWRDQSDK